MDSNSEIININSSLLNDFEIDLTSLKSVKTNNKIILYNSSKLGSYLLVYGYYLCKNPSSINFDISNRINSCYLNKNKVDIYSLSEGEHKICHQFDGRFYDIIISVNFKKICDVKPPIFDRPFNLYEIQLSTVGNYADSYRILIDLIKTSKNIVEKFTQYKKKSKDKIKRLIYDDYWQKLNIVPKRHKETLFLPENVLDNLIKFVEDFLDEENKRDFVTYGKPYKCNILFYGIPGAGKTSLINFIASHIDSNIGIINFNDKMDDIQLISAIRNFSDKDREDTNTKEKEQYKILVMEDIDCLFNERKKNDDLKNSITLSGLLNCLDGMYRNEGVITLLTANNISFLDSALIRPGRIDYIIKFDFAVEYQVKNMFKKFFPDQDFSKFWDKIQYKKFTTACLHQFLFYNRKSGNILDNIKELFLLINEEEERMKLNPCVVENKSQNLYL